MSQALEYLRKERINQLMRKTGYPLTQNNGQRHYGPPSQWNKEPPPKGSEIFIGKLPRDLYEDELVPLFEKVGTIYELRLMMDFSGSNRGFAFLTFSSPAEADRAIKELDNFEIRRGRPIGVCKSVDNCRLFVGGIPKDKTKEDVMREFQRITDGVKDVILYSNVLNKTKNRGFAFIEYDCHRSAAMARRKLIPARIPLWGTELAVDWAEPEPEVKEEVMNRVTVLFARNLTLSTTEEKLMDIFSLGGFLHVDKVKKIRDYAFIHYITRQEAEFALSKLNGHLIDGCVMEVTWSKPPQNAQKHCLRTAVDGYKSYPKHCLAVNAASSARNREEMIVNGCLLHGTSNGCSSCNRCLLLMPRVIPESNISHQNGNGFISVIGQPLKFNPSSSPLYVPPVAPTSVRNGQKKRNLIFKYPQILSFLCQEKGYGEPIFVPVNMTNGVGQEIVYTYKVLIPNLPSGVNEFYCPKFSKTPEEARIMAACYVIDQLGLSEECYDFYVPHNVFNASPAQATSPTRHNNRMFDYEQGASLNFSNGSTLKREQPCAFAPFDYGQGDGNGRALYKQAAPKHEYLNIKDHGDTMPSSATVGNKYFRPESIQDNSPEKNKSSLDESSWNNNNTDGMNQYFELFGNDVFKGLNNKCNL